MVDIVNVQLTIEQKISKSFGFIRTAKEELKYQRQMLKDAFENDADYKKINDELSANKTKLKARKLKMIEENPSLTTLQDKIDTLKDKLDSHQLTLSEFLIEYTEKTGNDTVPNDTGEIVKIKVKKSATVKKI